MLAHNSIGDTGAFALATAISNNNALNTLGIGNNGIGDKGASTLATGLTTNTVLNTLEIDGNSISDLILETIKSQLRRIAELRREAGKLEILFKNIKNSQDKSHPGIYDSVRRR